MSYPPSGQELLGVDRTCHCERRKLPIRVVRHTAEILRSCNLPPQIPVITYWCRTCKQIAVLTAEELHLVA